jgi:hypothetical protein
MSLSINSDFNGVTDPDAGRYIAAVEAADGQLLEFAVGKAMNNFIVGCKADGTWDAIKASCILSGARTLAGALVPLAGTAPTNNGFVSGDYNRKTGLVGNGSTKYLNSNRNNNADPQNNTHLALNLSTAMSGTVAAIGAQTVSPTCQSLIFSSAGTLDVRINSTSSYTPAANVVLGFLGVSRSTSATIVSRSSSVTASSSNSSTSPTSLSTFIFARNLDGSPNIHTSARCNFYSIGESLDLALLDTRVTTMINAFAAAIP